MLRFGALSSIGLLVVCSSCSEATQPVACADYDDVTVTVSTSSSPQIRWLPACFVGRVDVIRGADDVIVWSVGTYGSNGIAPPLTYGHSPEETAILQLPHTLQTGEYTVRVWLHLTTNGQVSLLRKAGEATFAR